MFSTFREILERSPDAVCAVTRNVATGEIVGIEVGRDHAGVQTLGPWSGRPVAWQDITGVPCWSDGGISTGSYRSEFVSRNQLLSLLS